MQIKKNSYKRYYNKDGNSEIKKEYDKIPLAFLDEQMFDKSIGILDSWKYNSNMYDKSKF